MKDELSRILIFRKTMVHSAIWGCIPALDVRTSTGYEYIRSFRGRFCFFALYLICIVLGIHPSLGLFPQLGQ